ncbi:TIGR04463 family radical SAM/SPASM RiPP maturase [Polyangium jinanense]|uniref:TIGR04463 family radical SAM/SPASM RiPP maturase n=1 Tax=Polyangium jinanense TaxID=2829994 RepID=A0A9X3X4I7_9BACT|nr:TIGR04463 family radical SAM/SPASM RiPP maturase [Polyangium jinanense]MDC3957228.1 TIGR04463 family radical SAM/SPASM RiPP maturase [Polyangium jinanense]MDC3982630.1 TIGR04463 family radical SAM/SPASM RiPP maturase [Polyangium jinanense]
MFKPSRYNIFVHLRNGRCLAYNSLSGGLGLWEADEWALYQRIEAGEAPDPLDSSVGEMVQAGYLVSTAMDELRTMEQAYRAHRFDPGSMILTIAPTMACNFGCDYCFQGQDKPAGSMTPEVQDAILAHVEQQAAGARSLHVAWYGGEPLVRREIIERLSDRLIECAARRHIAYSAMMVTNGYLLTADVARSLWARRVKTIQVTLDGAPEDHDQRRALLSGKPTFDRIAENLLAAVEATPITFSIRVNIDRRNADRVVDLLDLLWRRGLGGRRNFQVYFAPVEAITTGCHGVTDACLSKREYGDLEARLARHAFDRGLSSLPYPPRFRGTCAAVRPQGFVILPTGEIHKCWDTVNTPGRAVGTIFDMAAIQRSAEALRFTDWSPLDNESCRSCRILPSCAGACAYKFLYAEDTRGEQAVLPCPSWKYNIKERLVLRAEKSGAIGPHDYDRKAIRTDPAELCTEAHAPDAALHETTRTSRATRRVSLPVVPF